MLFNNVARWTTGGCLILAGIAWRPLLVKADSYHSLMVLTTGVANSKCVTDSNPNDFYFAEAWGLDINNNKACEVYTTGATATGECAATAIKHYPLITRRRIDTLALVNIDAQLTPPAGSSTYYQTTWTSPSTQLQYTVPAWNAPPSSCPGSSIYALSEGAELVGPPFGTRP
jgi:hypothetical protein